MSGELSATGTTEADTTGQATAAGLSGWSDWVGMVASIGCAIHCAAMPFVIAYLPALGLSFLADEAFHQWMAVGCLVIALAAFVPGLRKHGRFSPVIVASVGLTMISIAAFGFAGECCDACAEDAVAVASGEPGESGQVAFLASYVNEVEASDATCCPHCKSENEPVSSDSLITSLEPTGASTIASTPEAAPLSRWFDRLAPWLTPLGGMILVTGHVLNRRYGCLCGCCENESVTGAS